MNWWLKMVMMTMRMMVAVQATVVLHPRIQGIRSTWFAASERRANLIHPAKQDLTL